MSDRLGISDEVKELKFGETFNKGYRDGAFHTIRYDFKPASVDTQQMGTVEVKEKNEVMVTVPHVEGAGTSQTIFKGQKTPAAKECLLIIDRKTGKIELERISQNIRVKKTRTEGSTKKQATHRPPTPHDAVAKRPSPQNCSPSHPYQKNVGTSSSPSVSHSSPAYKSSPSARMSPHSRVPVPSKSPSSTVAPPNSMPVLGVDENKDDSLLSDSSSSDSDSGSSSSSDSDTESEPEVKPHKMNDMGMVNGIAAPSIYSDLALSASSDED